MTSICRGIRPISDQPRIVVVRDHCAAAIKAALLQAPGRLHPRARARIWVVRLYFDTTERLAWPAVLRRLGLTMTVVPDQAAFISVGPKSCR